MIGGKLSCFVGVVKSFLVLKPSCPSSLLPHAQVFPSLSKNIECFNPHATCCIGGRVLTQLRPCTWAVLPNPSCPFLLLPQAQTFPSVSSNRMKFLPHAIKDIVVCKLIIFDGKPIKIGRA